MITFPHNTILIVDDDPCMLKLTKNFLNSNGFSLLEASNGQQAVELVTIKSHKIDLIITDLHMPVANGLELATTLKSNTQCKHIPIILVTSDEQFKNDTRQNKIFDALFTKPVNFTTLLKKIKNLLSSKDVK